MTSDREDLRVRKIQEMTYCYIKKTIDLEEFYMMLVI